MACRCCVLFDDGTAFGEALARALARRSGEVVRVRAGGTYVEAADGFTMNPAEPSHYSQLIAALSARGSQVDAFVHTWRSGASAEPATGVEEALAAGFYSLLYLCQSIEAAPKGTRLKLAVLTRDAHVILGEERGDPYDAMLAACVRVIDREFANVGCQSIDVSLESISPARRAQLIDTVAAEALSLSRESVVAFRGTACFVPTFEQLDPTASVPSRSLLRPAGTYLITGGLGGIGLTLAGFLSRGGARGVVLTSRSDFPQRADWDAWLSTHGQDDISVRIRTIREIEAHGTEVLVVRADVTRGDEMRAAIAQTLERFGALHGVVHAAGLPGAGVIALKSREMTQEVMAPKVEGTLALRALVEGLGLDFFVCCSSIASILAPAGQFDYSAANAFQDAFAHANDRQGATRFISINWDGWKEVGMAVSATAQGDDKATGSHGMSCQEGCEVFRQILESPRPQWIVSIRELESALASPQGSKGIPERHGALQSPSISEEQTLAGIWKDLLGIEEPRIDDDFFALGGDSLLAIQLGTRMESHFGASITLRQLLETPTIAGLAKLLRNGNARPAREAVEA